MSTRARKSITRFMDTRERLKDFMDENQEMMSTFIALTEEYNADLNDAKGDIREVETDGRWSFGPFVRGKAPISTVYDPTKVDTEVLIIPGVVKAIDTKIVEGLVQEGRITADQVNPAKGAKRGTPRVSGPKTIEVVL